MTVDILSGGAASPGAAHFLALGLVAFFGAVLGGVSGFGAGLIVTPFLVPVVGVKGVVPVMAVAMTLGNLSRAWVYRRKIDPKPILRILIPALPGIALGAWLYDIIPHAPLAACIGVFLIASIPIRRHLAAQRIRPTPGAVVGVSFGFGTMSGALPGGGIVLLPLLLGLGLSGGALVGTDAMIGIAVNVAKIAMYGKLDLLDTQLMLGGLLVGLCMVPGAYGARFLIERMDVRLHTAVIECLVLFSGISFIYSAATA